MPPKYFYGNEREILKYFFGKKSFLVHTIKVLQLRNQK